jgi:predicted ATPase
MRELPTGTVTLLFTDIEGSTRLLEELGERYSDVLAEHRRLLREAFQAHGGIEVDTQGDAFFYAFAGAKDALAASAEAQQALLDGPVRVRIGLHTGEPIATEEGYVGIDVHRAARIMGAGYGGQVLVSETTQRLLDSSFELSDLGEHRLKDLAAPVRLYQLGSELFPPLKTLEQHPTNLPQQPTPLIGREHEVAEVSALLGRDDLRLLTLTGPGGTGKTRLALQAAAEVLERFPDGVFFVDLAPITDPALVVTTIAQTLGLRESGSEPLEQTLARFLAAKKLLLVLDNLEQVVAAGPSVAALLKPAEALKVLTTSRVPLRLAGEHTYSVSPLPEDDAVSLFVERARAVRQDFEPDEAVAEICRRLDGLPLALELAAARTRLLSPASILERLEQRLSLLTGGARDLPERQQTLRATLDWSHELLRPQEQRLFARLSVFVGGRTLEAAEEVCNPDGELGLDVLDGFATLVENSLLLPEEVKSGRPRFRMLETIHEYARQQLEQSGDAETIRSRHADYFLQLAEQAAPELRNARQQDWLDLLEAEHDNLRTALSWVRDCGDVEHELRLVGALGDFWYVHVHVREGRAWVENALARATPHLPAVRARALTAASYTAMVAGDFGRVTSSAEERIQLCRELDDLHGVAEAICHLGLAASASGDFKRASSLYESSRSLAREAGDRWTVQIATINLADLALRAGDPEQARVEAEAAVALARELGLKVNLAWSLVNLGHAKLLEGGAESISVYAESLLISRDIGAKENVLFALDGFAAAVCDAGEHERAVTLLAAVAAGHEATGIAEQGFEAKLHAQTLQAARRVLNDDEYAGAFKTGGAMSLEEAVDFALQPLSRPERQVQTGPTSPAS